MTSPFPGMDPYLEDPACWPAFQRQLIRALQQLLAPGLVERYRIRVEQRGYVHEQALFTSVIREEHHEEFLEIRQRSDGRLVTLVEVVSPTNKTTPEGRTAYLDKRREGRTCQANLVEIDLVRQGQPMLDYPRHDLPDWDYLLTVTRASQPERHEIYTATLRKRLPRFRLPLAADDRDTVIDLHSVLQRCYDQGDFTACLDYRRDPPVPLSEEDRRWMDDLLRQHKLR